MIAYPEVLIDWSLIAKAVHFYSQSGYTQTETPYAIPVHYHYYTKPHNDQSFVLNDGLFKEDYHELVGSAEQGFIYLLLNGKINPNSRLFSVTPCFRYDNYDLLHQPWFIKLELFHYSDSLDDLFTMLNLALSFYQGLSKDTVNIVQTATHSYDLEINDIEIASFGFRTVEKETFIYGTGLALPRFTIAKNNQGI